MNDRNVSRALDGSNEEGRELEGKGGELAEEEKGREGRDSS